MQKDHQCNERSQAFRHPAADAVGFPSPDTGDKEFQLCLVGPTDSQTQIRRWLRKRLATGFELFGSAEQFSAIQVSLPPWERRNSY